MDGPWCAGASGIQEQPSAGAGPALEPPGNTAPDPRSSPACETACSRRHVQARLLQQQPETRMPARPPPSLAP